MQLNPDENVFYPVPYVEGEAHLLVVTNQRIVHFGEAGKQEMAAREIQFLGRQSEKPFMTIGLLLGLLALPMIGFGIYFVATSGLLSSAKQMVPLGPPGDDPSVPGGDDDEEAAPPPEAPSLAAKIAGPVMIVLGFGLIVGCVLLVRVQRHTVLVRGGNKEIRIRAPSTMEQTQILATVGAVQTSAKSAGGAAPAAAAAAAPAAPAKVEVEDYGKPLEMLQYLAAMRAAGTISDEDFYAKREVLQERIKKKR